MNGAVNSYVRPPKVAEDGDRGASLMRSEGKRPVETKFLRASNDREVGRRGKRGELPHGTRSFSVIGDRAKSSSDLGYYSRESGCDELQSKPD